MLPGAFIYSTDADWVAMLRVAEPVLKTPQGRGVTE
jgi:hypothetical protein